MDKVGGEGSTSSFRVLLGEVDRFWVGSNVYA